MGFKLFSPNVGKNFGEAFNATVDRERKLKQQQDQFNQDMAFRNRQLGLLNIYRQDTEKRLQAAQDINKQVTEYGITSQYQEVPKGIGDVNLDRSFDPVLTPSGTSGGDLNKQFEGALNPFDPNKRYTPAQETPKLSEDRYETVSSGVIGEGGSKVNIIRDKHTNEEFEVPVHITPEKIKDSGDPNPQKWANFGKSVTEFKNISDKKSDQYKNAKTAARQSAYSTMLPNAYDFYKKHFIDGGQENVTNRYFLSRVRWGLGEDLINAEDAQDLIDFSSYRSDLFEIYK